MGISNDIQNLAPYRLVCLLVEANLRKVLLCAANVISTFTFKSVV